MNLMFLSAFLPSLPNGLRMEYLVFSIALGLAFSYFLTNSRIVSWNLLGLALLLLFGGAITIVFSQFSESTGAMASEFAMAGRLMLPIIVLASLAFYIKPNQWGVLKVAKLIVYSASVLGLLSVVSVIYDVSAVVQYFLNLDEAGVWSQSKALGRYTGIFNQPLEAGVFFATALLALIFLISNDWAVPFVRWCFLFVILAGGSLSLSKNFVVVGVVLSVFYAISSRVISRVVGIFLFFLILGMIILWLTLSEGSYVNSFLDLYEEGGLLLALTAGRLGSVDTGVGILWSYLWESGLWINGAGLGSHLPLDNGYFEYFYQGGVVALIFYMLFLIRLIGISLRHFSNPESKLLFYLAIFAILASLGGPVITANRANIAFLMLVAACVLCVDWRRRAGATKQ